MKKKQISLLLALLFVIVAVNTGIVFGAPKATKVVKKAKVVTKAKPVKKAKVATKAKPKQDTKAQIEAKVKAVFYKFIDASNKNNINEYMSTITSQEPTYSTAKQQMTLLIAAYKLSYKVTDYKVLSVDANAAIIQTTIEIRKITGPDFTDSTVVLDNLLQNEKGQWKIVGQKSVSQTPLTQTTTGAGINTTTDSAITTDSGIQ
jgi:hypothetical protein